MATAAENRDSDYITRVRELNRQVWKGIHALIAEQAQWNALDYGTTLDVPDAPNNAHEGLARADVGAVVFDTANALKAVLNAGHATNMSKLL